MPELPLDPELIAQRIRIPVSQWPGNCSAVAAALRDRFPVRGMRLTRGHWTGPVSPYSPFAGRPFTGHSWLTTEDGLVLDPTRWAFLTTQPFIYLGPSDCYDEGGLRFTERRPAPPPSDRDIPVSPEAARLLTQAGLSPVQDRISIQDIQWIVGRRPRDLPEAGKIYRALEGMGYRPFVQFDSWKLVCEPDDLVAGQPGPEGWFTLPVSMEKQPLKVLRMILPPFLDPDRNARIFAAMDEAGRLSEAVDAFTALEDAPSLDAIPREKAEILVDMVDKHFGVGNAVRIEAKAASLGISVVALHQALKALGRSVGRDIGWDDSLEARRDPNPERLHPAP
jgi:hypothetical protein